MTRDLIEHVLALVPDDWLLDPPLLQDPGKRRARFAEYLLARRDAASVFVEEAIRAHAARA